MSADVSGPGLRALGIDAAGDLLAAMEAGEIDVLLTINAAPTAGPAGDRWAQAIAGVGTIIAMDSHASGITGHADLVLPLLTPLEEEGVLVRRSRERLEAEIERFVVAEYDNHIVGCAALYAFPEEKVGELAALAVHPDFRREGYGEALMREVELRARKLKLARLFVLTTRTAHWFQERGFRHGSLADLPQQKQALYNWQRKSQVYVKSL